MVKYSKIISFLAVLLLGWYGVQAIFGLFTGGWINFYVRLFFVFILFFTLVVRYGMSIVVDCRLMPVLVIWMIYIFFFNYHSREFYVISSSLGLLSMNGFYVTTFIFIILAALFKQKKYDLNALLYRLFLFLSVVSSFIFLYMLKTVGVQFLFNEAVVYGTNVSLITFSYYITYNCIIGIYLISCKDLKYNRKLIIGLFILSVLLVLLMGKRGALLALVIPILALYFFKNLTIRRAITYLVVIFVAYFFVVENIDAVFDSMSLVSSRLADACRAAYYLGDNNGRDELWQAGLDQFYRNPLLGYHPRIIDVGSHIFFYGLHPHNYWIESLMTMGLLGSIPFFAYIAYLLFFKFYHAVASDSPYRFWALLLLSEIVHGTFSSPLNDSSIWTAMFVLSCFTCSKSQKNKA